MGVSICLKKPFAGNPSRKEENGGKILQHQRRGRAGEHPRRGAAIRRQVSQPKPNAQLLAKFRRLPPMPEGQGRRPRALQLLQMGLQEYLPRTVGRAVDRADRRRKVRREYRPVQGRRSLSAPAGGGGGGGGGG